MTPITRDELARLAHRLACKYLQLDDEDHEDDELTEPLEQLLLGFADKAVAVHDAAKRAELEKLAQYEDGVPNKGDEIAGAIKYGYNSAIDQFKTAIEKVYTEEG